MLGRRRCPQLLPDGQACRATPRHSDGYCFWHSPETEEAVAEARRLGGIRRRREKAVAAAYDFDGLGTVDNIRRVLDIATIDALNLENSIPRARVLISAASAATKLLEVGELEARLAALEAAVRDSAAGGPGGGGLLDGG